MKIFLGLLLIVLGLGVLWTQVFTTLASVFFLGWVLMIGGVSQIIYGLFSGNWRKTLLFAIMGVLAFFVGLVGAANPAFSAVTFTLFIGGLLLVSGIYRIIASLMTRETNWGWALTGGIISLLLGVWILAAWPLSGLFVIGLFIGAELIINGFLVMAQPAAVWEEDTEYTTSHYVAGAKGGKAKKKNKNEED